MITIRVAATGAFAIATMLSLQGCIGVGGSWSHDPSTARPTPPVAAASPAPRPTAPGPSAAASAGPAGSTVLGPIVGTVLIGPERLRDPRCTGAPLPPPVTVAVRITARDGQPAQVTATASYTLGTGAGASRYQGEVAMRFDAASGLYRATLPRLEARHFTGSPTSLSVTVGVTQGPPVQPGLATIPVDGCLGAL
ncbi:hypothetical protein [Catellatospora sp. NPDC049609]|uniref:hypothetical protein n=1 Tax=Catellatospora sp. NPDC049609 TaxID=3155505 RepID=UPI003447A85F